MIIRVLVMTVRVDATITLSRKLQGKLVYPCIKPYTRRTYIQVTALARPSDFPSFHRQVWKNRGFSKRGTRVWRSVDHAALTTIAIDGFAIS